MALAGEKDMNYYVDAYLAANLGDDLFVKILAEEFPNILFTMNYYGEYSKETFVGQKNILFPKYSLSYRVLNRMHIYDYINDAERISKEYDGFILLGGSIFREESFWGQVYHQRYSIIKAFREKNKPVFIIGSNFGPVLTQLFIDRYRDLFSQCTDVCFRDSYSYGLFSDLPNVRFERDVIFQYRFPKIQKKRDLIGFSIIDPSHVPSIKQKRELYLSLICNAIKEYIDKSFQCRIFAFCAAEGDEKIAYEIKYMLSEKERKKLEIEVYHGCIESSVQAIGECSVLVASRFHANVLGLLAGQAVIPLVYSDKTMNMLNDSLFPGEIIDIATIGLETSIPDNGCIYPFPVEEFMKSAQRQFIAIREHELS